MNDDFFIQGFVKAEMKKKVTYKPSVQIRTTCQRWKISSRPQVAEAHATQLEVVKPMEGEEMDEEKVFYKKFLLL
ncbi:hypothetical protein TNCV_2446161 [Trichonephila clavipes]|nr:hypothetical protein TNCV_2446161 [Trichonephila clavipes]